MGEKGRGLREQLIVGERTANSERNTFSIGFGGASVRIVANRAVFDDETRRRWHARREPAQTPAVIAYVAGRPRARAFEQRRGGRGDRQNARER